VLPNKLQPGKAATALDKAITAPQSAEDKFLAYAKMTPAEKMRAALLSSMGITEDQLKNMSPDQQKEIEQKIEDQIKQAAQKQLEKGGTAAGFFKDIQA
jgi:predicted phosphoribosyltransferase